MKLFTVLALGIAIFGIHFSRGLCEEAQEGDFVENLNPDSYSDDEEIPNEFKIKEERYNDYDDDKDDDENKSNLNLSVVTNSDSEEEMPKAMFKQADQPKKSKKAPVRLRRIRTPINRQKMNKICKWVNTAPYGLPGSKFAKWLCGFPKL